MSISFTTEKKHSIEKQGFDFPFSIFEGDNKENGQ